MKRAFVILVATASTLVLSAAAWHVERPSNAREAHIRAEVVRLHAHFDSVDTELRTRDVSHLSDAQRASRVKLIAWLREYRDAGQFPENDRFANESVPFFRDTKGTLCAMAYLVDRSGRGDIVDHIAKTRNNAFIRELTDDARLVAWLDASGLSVSEAARIQPAYDGDPCCLIGEPDRTRVSREYALVSAGFGGVSLASLGFNVFSASRTSVAAGLMAGAASIIAGVAQANPEGGRKNLVTANIAVGSVSLLAGIRALYANPSVRKITTVQTSKRSVLSDAAVAPDLIVSPTETRVGLRMNARF